MTSFFTSARVVHATKVAVAATVAWVLVLPIGGVADEYPYYAPLGAVVSVASTVAASMRTTISSIVAIALGAVPAVIAVVFPVWEVLALAIVVWVGAWVSTWRRLGPMASWVPISGLFILILGQGDPWHYAGAYLGLVGFGALVGVGIQLLWPTLPLHASEDAQDSLRVNLAGQLEDLAEGLSRQPLPTMEEWGNLERAIDSHSHEMYRMVDEAREAQRGNWRASRWKQLAHRQYRQARALEQLSFLVEDAYDLVTRTERAELEEVALGPELRPRAVHALKAMAHALSGLGDAVSDTDSWLEARHATDALAEEIRNRQFETSSEFFVAASLVTTLRRALVAIEPRFEEEGEREPASRD